MTNVTDGANSALAHLEGPLSGERYDADALMRLGPKGGRPLLARYDLEKAAATLTKDSLARRRSGGMWRWTELLPVRGERNIVLPGEGDTPLLPQRRLEDAMGVSKLSTKAEGLNPTGSFKARGMSAAVSRAVELGAKAFIGPLGGERGGRSRHTEPPPGPRSRFSSRPTRRRRTSPRRGSWARTSRSWTGP